jgi:hypothetical protein
MDLTKILPVIGMSLCAMTSFSQTLLPIAVPESKWINSYFEEVKRYDSNDDAKTLKTAKQLVAAQEFCILAEDSLINNKAFLKMDDCSGTYIGSVRDDQGKLMFVPRNSTTESVVYDFTASKGDVIKSVLSRDLSGTYQHTNVVVTSVDSVSIAGYDRKRINFDGGSWVEGIGNEHGLFMSQSTSYKGYFKDLTCMCNGEKTLYPLVKTGVCKLPASLKRDMAMFTELIRTEPSRGWFVMEFDRRVDSDEVFIINSKGQMIKPNMSIQPDRIMIDLSAYEEGNYVMLLKNDKTLSLGRLVKI